MILRLSDRGSDVNHVMVSTASPENIRGWFPLPSAVRFQISTIKDTESFFLFEADFKSLFEENVKQWEEHDDFDVNFVPWRIVS